MGDYRRTGYQTIFSMIEMELTKSMIFLNKNTPLEELQNANAGVKQFYGKRLKDCIESRERDQQLKNDGITTLKSMKRSSMTSSRKLNIGNFGDSRDPGIPGSQPITEDPNNLVIHSPSLYKILTNRSRQ
jgi:hypothetical protein